MGSKRNKSNKYKRGLGTHMKLKSTCKGIGYYIIPSEQRRDPSFWVFWPSEQRGDTSFLVPWPSEHHGDISFGVFGFCLSKRNSTYCVPCYEDVSGRSYPRKRD